MTPITHNKLSLCLNLTCASCQYLKIILFLPLTNNFEGPSYLTLVLRLLILSLAVILPSKEIQINSHLQLLPFKFRKKEAQQINWWKVGPTDGLTIRQTLLWRCVDSSKKLPKVLHISFYKSKNLIKLFAYCSIPNCGALSINFEL